jgi:hypothetical protein
MQIGLNSKRDLLLDFFLALIKTSFDIVANMYLSQRISNTFWKRKMMIHFLGVLLLMMAIHFYPSTEVKSQNTGRHDLGSLIILYLISFIFQILRRRSQVKEKVFLSWS